MIKCYIVYNRKGRGSVKRKMLKNLTLSSMFIAVGIVLPFFTGQIPQIGNMMLPMHLPVFFCGLICGWQWGALVGFILPLMRSFMFSVPIFYPAAIAMAFELMTYGAVSGFLYNRSKWQCIVALYRSLIAAMISGRFIWAAAEIVLLGVRGNVFTVEMFISSAFITAIPGIIIQLVFIPAIMVALDRTGLVKFKKAAKKETKTA